MPKRKSHYGGDFIISITRKDLKRATKAVDKDKKLRSSFKFGKAEKKK